MNKASVLLVVKNTQGEFLLQFRDNAAGIANPLCWALFGGGVDAGEELKQAALRELDEECGVTACVSELKLLGSKLWRQRQRYLFELTRPVELDEIRLGEGAGLGAFSLAELKLIDMAQFCREILLEFAISQQTHDRRTEPY